MMSASLRPETQSIATSAPSGMNSFADSSRTRASIPRPRNISKVRMWKKAARGRGELSFSRSIAIERTPCWARNEAAARPVRPPPAIRTGASYSTRAPSPPELAARQAGPLGHGRELHVDDVRIDGAETREGAEAAVGAGHDALASHDIRELQKAFGHQ